MDIFKNVQFQKKCQTLFLKNVTIKKILNFHKIFLNLYALKSYFFNIMVTKKYL